MPALCSNTELEGNFTGSIELVDNLTCCEIVMVVLKEEATIISESVFFLLPLTALVHQRNSNSNGAAALTESGTNFRVRTKKLVTPRGGSARRARFSHGTQDGRVKPRHT
jgi:hypothetical protein